MKQKDKERLVRETVLAKVNSYSPYSKFRVGAGIILKNGDIYKGANIENSSYPCSICAERNVLSTVYGLGFRKEDILAMAISSDSKEYISPCGMCAQVISELVDENTPLFLINVKNEVKEVKSSKFLPYAFDLNKVK